MGAAEAGEEAADAVEAAEENSETFYLLEKLHCLHRESVESAVNQLAQWWTISVDGAANRLLDGLAAVKTILRWTTN